MANIKEQLSAPESGWKRYDNTDNNIVYNGTGWKQPPGDIGIHYNNSCFLTQTPGENYVLYVYTSRIRIISDYHYNMGIFTINIDDNYTCDVDCYQTGEKYQHLMFEKTDLEKTVHKITVTLQEKVHPGLNMLVLDAIDIDEDGYLIEPRTFGERYTTFDESVWQRIDDTNEYIQYIGTNWDKYNVSVTTMGAYNNSRHASCVKDDYTTFKVYTSKIRIYVNLYYDNTDIDSHDIYIDGKLVKSFSSYKKDVTDMSTAGQRLIYENLQMEKKEHTITLKNNQTNSTSWLMPDCFEIDSDGYMLTPDRSIGDSLIKPDPTWIRIDDTNEKIIYSKGWESYNSGDLYRNSHHQTNILNENVTFYFYGTKLRIINSVNSDRTKNIKLTIDDNTYYYSEYLNSVKYKILVFEQCNLKNTFHKVKITNTENKYITLDCIDIDEHGYLLTEEEYNQYIKEQKKNDISINKTLKANLPSSTTKGIEIHFTEDGEMYVNKQDGSFIKVNSSYKTYSSEETYNINDYVVYNNKLYKCIENITVAEDFNVSKWQIVLEGAKGDPGEKGSDAANISKLYCKDNNLYVDFDNDTTKQIENFSLNKAVNEQVEYGQFGFNNTIEQISTLDTLIPFKTKVGNIALNSDGTITLTKGKTYKLSCYFRITDTNTLKALSIKQNETFLFNVVAQASEITETCTSIYIFTPTENVKVGLYTTSISIQLPTLTSAAFYDNTKLIVEEIAQPIIKNNGYTIEDIQSEYNKIVTLYDGFANTQETEYDLTGSIEDYDLILIYTSVGADTLQSSSTRIINVKDIAYSDKTANQFEITENAMNDDARYRIGFSFTSSNKFYIQYKMMGNATYWKDAGIKKIEGIKTSNITINNTTNCNISDISNNDKSLEDTPIGHIMSFMGTKAPDHYLICDGSEYNIADYQKLADFINDQFGSYNYFGGDGTTTFAVPDLRNEFIRGYHGDSIDTLSGDIGKHQDATVIQNPIGTNSANSFLLTPVSNKAQTVSSSNIHPDNIQTATNSGIYKYTTTTETNSNTVITSYTTRPTNVAVLFCIKYDHTYYVNVTNNNTYRETVLYKNNIPIVSTLDNLDTTKYATTDTPMELTFDEDLSQYDRLEIVLGTVTYSGNNYWIPINDKINGKGNENIYYRNCLMVTKDSYCSVQLDYFYTDKKIELLTYGMSTSDMKGATILSVIGIKYVSSNVDASETYTDESVNTEIDNILKEY